MITAYDISLARPAHALEIAQLSRDAIEYDLPWRWTQGRVMRSIRDAATNVVVARRDGELLGFAVMKYGEDEAHVLLLAVRAAQRRSGLGSALLAWLEATASVAGIRTIRLEARAANAAARAFYRRHGFEESGVSPRYYEDAEDGVRMVKHLGSGS